MNSLEALNRPIIMVLNKVDLIKSTVRPPISGSNCKTIEVSALTGVGLEDLLRGITETLPQNEIEVDVFAPYKEGWVIPFIHENGKLLNEEFNENGVIIKAVMNKIKIERIKDFIICDSKE